MPPSEEGKGSLSSATPPSAPCSLCAPVCPERTPSPGEYRGEASPTFVGGSGALFIPHVPEDEHALAVQGDLPRPALAPVPCACDPVKIKRAVLFPSPSACGPGRGVQAYYRYRGYGRPFAQATLKTGSKEACCAKPVELRFDGNILFINYLRRVKQQDISALVNVETTFAE